MVDRPTIPAAEAVTFFHGGNQSLATYYEQAEAACLRVASMAEIGMDITGQSSKTLDRYLGEPFDGVITVCDPSIAEFIAVAYTNGLKIEPVGRFESA